MEPIFHWGAYFCGAMAIGAVAFQVLCLLGAWDFRRQKFREPDPLPPVSILKPLKGADPEMYESFRSHCLQDYPEYEIIFGVSDAADEAVRFVERLKAEYPQQAIRMLVCTNVVGANRKVSNLAEMMQVAKFEHVVINDSDIRVPADYLRRVIPGFDGGRVGSAKVGMVTCLYRAIAGRNFWSKMESLGVTMDFMPPVLAARFLEGRVYFGLGSTMAVRKEAVQAIGGLESIADYLADDYELGTRIADAGYTVVLSDVVVETFVPEYTAAQFFDHQLRWGRAVRSSRPGGYAGVIVTFGFFWSLLAMLLSGAAWWSPALLAVNVFARLIVTQVVGGGIIGHGEAWKLIWLMPLRDLLAPYIWLFSLGGSRIVWRGEIFRLRKGKLSRD
jgi:ceramide glucosyltransferase